MGRGSHGQTRRGGGRTVHTKPDQRSPGDGGTTPRGGPKPGKLKIDIGVVAALGVAVGGITAALGVLLQAFFGLGVWMRPASWPW